MSNPHYIKVHRGEDPSPDTKQQPASFSEQTKNWLREGHKDMPWHNIDSVAVSDTQDNSDINGAPSDSAATQGNHVILIDRIPDVAKHLVHDNPHKIKPGLKASER
ncbi:hypothetical protein FOTG_05092 [Fusarium oxysporum f. sp. vasinfectum 25433]|uniref:Uncharacterized protein n=1 Tax=Fusarium oxysporum f. sp. vasinfectum 25433 TaxID=1089449 RepID=X0M953_FUSOX|nr:hypothetical protein FOTG_05092 [Fusarium oxysporum f. sp. vasinfectum 25433]